MGKKIPLLIIQLFLVLLTINFISAEFGYNKIETNRLDLTTGNLTTFLELTDTPASYGGEGGNCVKVGVGETALEFGACGTGTLDGNASSICGSTGGDTFLLGNSSCMNVTDISGSISDTNTSSWWINFTLTDCPAGNYTYGIESNGTKKCRDDLQATGAAGNPFDQSLNISDNVTFYTINASDWSNVTLTESQIKDLVHTTDSNTTEWILNITTYECPTGNYTYGFYVNGTVQCRDDLNTGSGGGNTTQEIIDAVNNTGGWVLNFSRIYSLDWSNITILESQITDLVHTTDTNTTYWVVNATAGDCPAGNYSYGFYANGTKKCRDDLQGAGASGNPFDQVLNTTSNVTFQNITSGTAEGSHYLFFYEGGSATGESIYWNDIADAFYITDSLVITGGIDAEDLIKTDSFLYTTGSGDNFWLGAEAKADSKIHINTTGNARVQNISADYYYGNGSQLTDIYDTDTTIANETSRVLNLTASDCAGTDKMIGVQANGTVLCAEDQTGTGGKQTSDTDPYLRNDSGIIYFNESQLNVTIDRRGNLLFNETTLANLINTTLTTNKLDITDQRYNETALVNSLNLTVAIQNLLNGTSVFFNIVNASTYCIDDDCISSWDSVNQSSTDTNETSRWINATLTDCPAGNYSFGFYSNGTKKCRDDIDTDTTIPDTNTSSWITNITSSDCPVGNYSYGHYPNGTVICRDDIDTDTQKIADDATDWIYNDTTIMYFNESKLETIYYNATLALAIVGTLDGGGLDNLSHPDGNYDGQTFNFTEEAGSPGLDLRMNFTGVSDFNAGVMRYKTDSLAGDYPIIQLWNYDDSSWEDYPEVAESPTFATIEQSVFDSTEHLNGGIVQMRLYKASNGNTGNSYYVDWLAISKGFGTPTGEEVDPLSVHRDGDVALTANWEVGGFVIHNFTANLSNIFSLDWTNVSITLSQISDYAATYNTTQEIRNAINDSVEYDFASNTSDFWDNLDSPTDITNSEFWYNMTLHTFNIFNATWDNTLFGNKNHTLDTYTIWNDAWLSTYNATYAAFTDSNETERVLNMTTYDCGAGQQVIGIQANGTVLCVADADTNTFNTTQEILTAVNISAEFNFTSNSSNFWDNLNAPTDITNSEFWYNHTLHLFTLFNATWDNSLFGNTNHTLDVVTVYNASWDDSAVIDSVNTTVNIQTLINGTNLNLGSLNVSNGNITLNESYALCLNAGCTRWIKSNNSGTFIQG